MSTRPSESLYDPDDYERLLSELIGVVRRLDERLQRIEFTISGSACGEKDCKGCDLDGPDD